MTLVFGGHGGIHCVDPVVKDDIGQMEKICSPQHNDEFLRSTLSPHFNP